MCVAARQQADGSVREGAEKAVGFDGRFPGD